ncbi:AsmA family protein [Kushneria aurantia]|uniref:AsmA family protein n=1 Tax=Kushneria aurantia TaxID=504092 RepID=A0ABV6G808_9GAMM|nr:AsmA family protein [Kushneria aurantia]
MKALFRIVLAAIGVLGLLAVAVVIYATTFLDPNDLKPRLADAVRERTGLELSLDGPLSWSFYPRIGLTVEDASARLPGQAEDAPPFAAFERAEARIRFAPLLAGNIEVDGFTLDGLRLNLVRNEAGRANWEVLANTLSDQRGRPPAESAPRAGGPQQVASAGDRPLVMNIASVNISDGQVHYIDRQSGRDVTLSDFGLDATNVTADAPFPVEAGFSLESLTPRMNGRVDLVSQAAFDPDAEQWSLRNLRLKSTLQAAALEGEQSVELNADAFLFDTDRRVYRLKGAALNATLQLASLPEGQTLPLAATFNADLDLAEGSAGVSDLRLSSTEQLTMSGGARIAGIGSELSWQGELTMPPANLRSWLGQLGMTPTTADSNALTAVGFSTRLSGDDQRGRLQGLSVRLDDTDFNGELTLGLDTPLLHGELSGGALDLDRYLPAADEASQNADAADTDNSAAGAAADAEDEGAAPSPLALLSRLDLDLLLRLDGLSVRGARLTQLTLQGQGSDGLLRLAQLDAELYGGRLDASGKLDLREVPASLQLSPQLEGVALQPLLTDTLGRDDLLRGSLSAGGEFSTSFGGAGTPLAQLDGSARFNVTDGALVGFNLPGVLCSAVATLEGNGSGSEPGSDTPFERLSGSLTIDSGVVSSDDIDIAIPGAEARASGDIDLTARQLALQLGLQLNNSAALDGCPISDALTAIILPLRCEGSLDGTPADWCRLDTAVLRDRLQSAAVERGGEALQERLEGALDEHLGEGQGHNLRETIKGLFQ